VTGEVGISEGLEVVSRGIIGFSVLSENHHMRFVRGLSVAVVDEARISGFDIVDSFIVFIS